MGNFVYSNLTKLYFGEDSLKYLNEDLPKYGKTIQLIYGGGSIKRAWHLRSGYGAAEGQRQGGH